MKSISQYILENEETEYEDDSVQKTIPGGIDIALVGEIRLFTMSSELFSERKEKIAEYYMNEIPRDMVWTADFIDGTPIFRYYVRDVIAAYKSEIDENMKLNISSHDELCRQLADDIILLSKKHKL